MNKLIVVLLLSLSGCATGPCVNRVVENVGGCDRNGFCGVRYYEDGSVDRLFYPVKGQTVCTHQ